MFNLNFRRHLILGFLSAGLLVPSVAWAEPVKIRIGYVIPVTSWPSFIFEKPEILKHYGKSYVVEATQYRGTPALVNALAVGEAELVELAYSSLAFAIENAGMSDLRIVADDVQDGANGYSTSPYYVRKDSGIMKVEDLKGKILATPGSGSAVDIAVRVMLLRHGLSDKKDYTVIEAPWPTMRAMLAEKKVDFVPTTIPFSFDPKWKEVGHQLFTTKDALGPSQLIILTARQATIEKYRAALTDLFEDAIIAFRYFNNPANRAELLKVVSKVGKQPEAAYADWVLTKNDYYRDPMLMPNLEGLQRAVDAQREVGIIGSKIDVKKYVDLSLVEDAAKRIK